MLIEVLMNHRQTIADLWLLARLTEITAEKRVMRIELFTEGWLNGPISECA
jgi:hypothetical protein